jgi:hypothetical protein
MNRKELDRRKQKNEAAQAARATGALLRGDPIGKGGRPGYLNKKEEEELVKRIKEWEDPVLQPSAEDIPKIVYFLF